MHSIRLMGVVLIAATWIAFQPSQARADSTAWSTNAASCVPVRASGFSVTAGAVTAGAGVTVTLYCGITREALTGGFQRIEITYRGGKSVVSNAATSATKKARAIFQTNGLLTSELIEMSKVTGTEMVKCGIQAKGSATIATENMLCENSMLDFNNKFYYLRIVLKSGIIAGQLMTIFGSSLTSSL